LKRKIRANRTGVSSTEERKTTLRLNNFGLNKDKNKTKGKMSYVKRKINEKNRIKLIRARM